MAPWNRCVVGFDKREFAFRALARPNLNAVLQMPACGHLAASVPAPPMRLFLCARQSHAGERNRRDDAGYGEDARRDEEVIVAESEEHRRLPSPDVFHCSERGSTQEQNGGDRRDPDPRWVLRFSWLAALFRRFVGIVQHEGHCIERHSGFAEARRSRLGSTALRHGHDRQAYAEGMVAHSQPQCNRTLKHDAVCPGCFAA